MPRTADTRAAGTLAAPTVTPPRPAASVPPRYLATVFLSAFLLFLVQPMIARRILPWFGGAAAVWTTCLLFFQTVLLGGYYYAHRLDRAARPGRIHIAILAASVLLLPALAWTAPPTGANPVLGVLAILAAWVGGPYFVLSATGPLLQAWYSREFPGSTPYRMYAVSNLGSMLGLLAYPVLIEPFAGTRLQLILWAAGYAVFAVLCGRLATRALAAPVNADLAALGTAVSDAAGKPASTAAWLIFPAAASAALLAVTNHLTQNIAPVPFLWILPLTLYLVTLIISFDKPEWCRPALFHPLAMAALGAMAWALVKLDPSSTLSISIPLFNAGLFCVCMYCHGELAARKPAPAFLTSYYLRIALGGALGALVIAVGAPLLLRYSVELALVVAACALIGMFGNWRKNPLADLAWTGVAIGAVVAAMLQVQSFRDGNLAASRNFYGALRVTTVGDGAALAMIHGIVNHGLQWRDDARKLAPTTYYGPTGGAGRLLSEPATAPRRVGVIGLGAGTLAAYANPGDSYRFYELDPQVIRDARQWFTFLGSSKAAVDVIAGDGRLSLDREAPNNFDVLVVDAFSGDSIPVHLLTREAAQLYRRRLKSDGVLALHLSNSVLDLAPVAAALAQSLGATAHIVRDPGNAEKMHYASIWALIPLDGRPVPGTPLNADPRRLWTDDYSNLLGAIRW
ncbi:MAG: fused MFS/spermidine synthase [Bryobacteraceae bacterium]